VPCSSSKRDHLNAKSSLAHDLAAIFALLELILKLKTSNSAGVPQKPNPTDLLMQPPCMD